MPHPSDPELQQWIATWQTPTSASNGTPEAIFRHVQRRSRLLWFWLAGEVAIVMAVAPVLVWTAMAGDTLDKLAMASLAAIATAAIAFSWWNWHGAIHGSGESTAAFLRLSYLRVEKLGRAAFVGWMVLGAEVLVFILWIGNRLYGNGAVADLRSQVFSWGLLGVMTLLCAWFLVRLARWAERERSRLESLRAELDDESPHR
jgi:hypothetical protein